MLKNTLLIAFSIFLMAGCKAQEANELGFSACPNDPGFESVPDYKSIKYLTSQQEVKKILGPPTIEIMKKKDLTGEEHAKETEKYNTTPPYKVPNEVSYQGYFVNANPEANEVWVYTEPGYVLMYFNKNQQLLVKDCGAA